MSAAAILFLAAALIIAIKAECALQKQTWRSMPPRWIGELVLVFAVACQIHEIIKGVTPGWPITLMAAGVALLLLFDRPVGS